MLRYRLKSKSVPVIAGVTVERRGGLHGLWGAYFYDVPCVCGPDHQRHYHPDRSVKAYPEFVLQPRQCDGIDAWRADGSIGA